MRHIWDKFLPRRILLPDIACHFIERIRDCHQFRVCTKSQWYICITPRNLVNGFRHFQEGLRQNGWIRQGENQNTDCNSHQKKDCPVIDRLFHQIQVFCRKAHQNNALDTFGSRLHDRKSKLDIISNLIDIFRPGLLEALHNFLWDSNLPLLQAISIFDNCQILVNNHDTPLIDVRYLLCLALHIFWNLPGKRTGGEDQIRNHIAIRLEFVCFLGNNLCIVRL